MSRLSEQIRTLVAELVCLDTILQKVYARSDYIWLPALPLVSGSDYCCSSNLYSIRI